MPFPDNPIEPVDDLPPATVILSPAASQVFPTGTNHLKVIGTCIDASKIASITVNGVNAKSLGGNSTRWVAELSDLPEGEFTIEASARDKFGNMELTPHLVTIMVGQGTITSDQLPSDDSVPTEFVLQQNYPNPFNPSTTFRYALAEPGQVSLMIYNMLGQLVRTVIDEHHAEGYYEIIWDGRNEAGATASSGIYTYRMTAGNRIVTKKMILMK